MTQTLCDLLMDGSFLQQERKRMDVQRKAVSLIQDVALALRLSPWRKGQLECLDQHRDNHAQLHHRQRLASAVVGAIREWYESIFTQDKLRLRSPTLRHELIRSNECAGIYQVLACACGLSDPNLPR